MGFGPAGSANRRDATTRLTDFDVFPDAIRKSKARGTSKSLYQPAGAAASVVDDAPALLARPRRDPASAT